MLTITVPSMELYDRSKCEFVELPEVTLQLEHSLISVSKWESKWQKPFLSEKNKTGEEMIDYIKDMTLTQKVPENVFLRLSEENLKAINSYISSPMTATWFNDKEKKNGVGGSQKEIITSEIIYYWMFSFNIPMECQKWHLNRLLTLIRVCSIKNNSNKKQSKEETLMDYKAINAKRRAEAAARMKGVKK